MTLICVFPSTCKDFSNNGLGPVLPQSCTVTETLNGEWELALVHPIDEDGRWQNLTEGNILRAPVPASSTPQVKLVSQTVGYDLYRITTVRDPLRLRSGTGTNYYILGLYPKGALVVVLSKPNASWYEVLCPDGRHGYMAAEYLTYVRTEGNIVSATGQVILPRQLRDQPFRIYRVVPELDKITVYARHIFYDLLDNMLKSYKPTSTTVGTAVVQNIASMCLSGHNFTFYSDLTSTADEVEFENINPVEALLGEGGLTEKYGAELARDWFDVFLVNRVGTDTDVHIREQKNLTGISYDVDETDVVTRIMPTGEDTNGNILYLPELYVDSPYIAQYVHLKWVHLKVAEAKEVTEGERYKSITECCLDMRKAAYAEFAKGCDLPTVTLKVDFINCKDVEEYKQYSALSDIYLGDSVRVIARRIGVEVDMRMMQYTYDCLMRKYTAVTLGTAADTLEGSMISARQLASGSISGMKLALNSVGSGQLQNGSVGSLQVKNAAIQSAHIQQAAITSAHILEASITRAHIAEALIDVLNANALSAVTAKIKELAAGSITADELYASIAAIAYAQLTTANIVQANIRWADIENLTAEVARISKAQINTATIEEADIQWAAITSLTAATAEIVRASIGTADIDWAHIKDLATDTAIITQGMAGELYIAKLAVTEANMVSLTVGELVVRGADGHFYAVTVDENGGIVTTLKQVGNDDVADLSINAGEKIIQGSITAGCLNVQDIFASNALIRSLIAASIDVDTLFARQATINAINAMDITSNTYLRLMVEKKADQEDVEALGERVTSAELKITPQAIVSTVTGSAVYQQDMSDLLALINNGTMTISNTAPENPAVDMLWLDTSISPNMLKRWDGIAWVDIGSDVDLSAYYTKTELDTRFQQTQEAIMLKADKTVTDALGNRLTTAEATLTTQAGQIAAVVSQATDTANDTAALAVRMAAAELKITPDALMTSVRSSTLYRYDRYAGRNYVPLSHQIHTFVNNNYQYADGSPSAYTGWSLDVSPDLYSHSGNGESIRISFEIKRTDIDAAASAGIYSGVWIYYRYYGPDGTTINTTGRGWYLRTTDIDFNATDQDWVRIVKGPLNLAQYSPISIAYFMYGTISANGTIGTVQFRNLKIEVGDTFTEWSAAPEDMNSVPGRLSTAESSIAQHGNQIALKVNTAIYDAEKVYRSATEPSIKNANMLWLDTSLSPPILKRWTGSLWGAVGAQELKTSGIAIGSNNVAITTENFLLQLLDPGNNENVLMEMSADGKVGFRELYADDVISGSVASAYDGPSVLYINPSYSGTSDTYFHSLGEAVKVVNGKFLRSDVTIYLPSASGAVYEPSGVHISGLNGPGRFMIFGYSACTLNSYISIKGCSAHIQLQNVSLRESRPLNGGNRNPYLVECLTNHYVEVNGCTLDANGTTYDSVYACATHIFLNNTGLYNAQQGLEVYQGMGVIKNCRGSCSWAMVAYAGLIFANGTVPSGSRSAGENGQVYASNVTVDYGAAAAPVTPDQMTIQQATLTSSWRGSWRTDTLDVVQGLYSDTGYDAMQYWNRGCMWFGTLRNALLGKTIRSATLTLYRKTGSGAGNARSVYLCAITNTTTSGTLNIAVNYGPIGIIGRGEQVTFSIPVSAVQGLVNGSFGGLCLYEPSYNFGSSTYSSGYMRLAGMDSEYRPFLEVVYNG